MKYNEQIKSQQIITVVLGGSKPSQAFPSKLKPNLF